MLIANIVLSISTLTTLVLGLFVIVSNPRRGVNRAFFGVLAAAFIWLLANLLTNLSRDPDVALLFARSTLIGAALLPYTFLLFCMIFTQDSSLSFRKFALLAAAPLVIISTFLSPLNIESVEAYGANTITGPVYFLLVPLLLAYFGWGLAILTKNYHRSKDAITRAQLRYIILGIFLTVVPAVIMNGILPALGDSKVYLYGPNTIVIMVSFIAIAMVKHRLLDIRLLVARSLTYLMIGATLTGLYGIIVYGAATTLLGSNEFSERIVPLIAAVFLAFTLQPLSRFFNRITNKFFYRDAYDTQAFLDQLNRTLVSTFELNQLLRKSAQIIESNLKPTFCAFGLKETSTAPQRVIGTANHPDFSAQDIAFVREITPHFNQKLILVDSLEAKHQHLKKVLEDNNINVIVRLTSSAREEGIGYLVLGPKKSGVPYDTQDIKNLEIVANELVIAIQNSLRFEEIEAFNITLQQKVDEATRKLRRTNEKLKALDEAKDDFVSMASHQLRTPLTSIKGYTSMVLEGDAGRINTTQRKLLQQSFASSQRMVYLIADLLNVSRLKTGKFIIEPVPVNLAEVVQQEIGQLKETAAGRSLELTYEMPKDFPSIMLDETKTRQVIMNFVDNAIYYTPAGGHITVSVKETPSAVEFRVSDDGIGVPKHEQPHLFTKFYRAGNARTARPDGTGLGLFMAKKVVVAEGGAIIFESEENKGSTFGFVFSKSKAPTDKTAAS